MSAAIISILFLSELAYFLSTDVSVYLFYIDACMYMCVSASIHEARDGHWYMYVLYTDTCGCVDRAYLDSLVA